MDYRAQFDACADREEARNLYRKLSKANHPDLGGCKETMQAINLAYEGYTAHSCGGDSAAQGVERDLASKIAEVMGFGLPESVEVELVGLWLWMRGDTKPYKEQIKAAGFRWSARRGAWHWTPVKAKWRPSSYDMDAIRMRYGSTTYRTGNSSVASR